MTAGTGFEPHGTTILCVRRNGVVAMGGYNTFCEILSFDKPAIIVPRRQPRLEQLIRAERAQALGLVRMLTPEPGCDPGRMAAALHALPTQVRPSAVAIPGLLDGLEVIRDAVEGLLAREECRDAAWAL